MPHPLKIRSELAARKALSSKEPLYWYLMGYNDIYNASWLISLKDKNLYIYNRIIGKLSANERTHVTSKNGVTFQLPKGLDDIAFRTNSESSSREFKSEKEALQAFVDEYSILIDSRTTTIGSVKLPKSDTDFHPWSINKGVLPVRMLVVLVRRVSASRLNQLEEYVDDQVEYLAEENNTRVLEVLRNELFKE